VKFIFLFFSFTDPPTLNFSKSEKKIKNKIDFFFRIFIFSDVDIFPEQKFPELRHISMANLCHLLHQEHDASHM